MEFRRRKCDVARYNRAKSLIGMITYDYLKQTLQDVIESYETESKMIDFFVNHPNLQVKDCSASKDGKKYSLSVKVIQKREGKYIIEESQLTCSLVGENYVEKWRNIGNDYHSLHLFVKTRGEIDYWYSRYDKFLLEQLENQDKLSDMISQLEIMKKNYF